MSADMRIACVMMQRNERELLAPWIEYHAALCGIENIHIFDNGSDDPETLGILERYRSRGVAIDRTFSTRADFNRKGDIIADKIRALDQRCDFYFPLDCDEFLACRTGDGFSVERTFVVAALEPYRADPRVLAIGGALDNNPAHPDWYRLEPAQRKCFFAAGTCRSLDIGFHEGLTVTTDEVVKTDIVYFHLHNRPFAAQKYFSTQKLEGRIASFSAADLEQYEHLQLPGFHLIPALLDDKAEYDARHAARPPLHVPQLSVALQRLGVPLVPAGSYPEAELPKRAKVPPKPPRGCIDTAVVTGLTLRIIGWALGDDGQPATPRCIRIGGVEIDSVTVTPVPRSDVAMAQGTAAVLSGFLLEISLVDLLPEWLEGNIDVMIESQADAVAWLAIPSALKLDLETPRRVLRVRPKIAGRPGLTSNALAHFEQRLGQAKTYLEYGMGGTTVRAAEVGVADIVSIESDPVWFDLVRHQLGKSGLDRKHLIRADIGVTGEWGFPTGDEGWRNYARYVLDPWIICQEQRLKPDLVLIDGRFRLACSLAALLHAQTGACILFDDYADRPYYRSLESFVRCQCMVDGMAEFIVPADLQRDEIWRVLVKATADPR